MTFKICRNCDIPKPINEFWQIANGKYYAYCKECARIKNRQWKENNRDKSRAIARRHYRKNKIKIYEALKEWRKANPEKMREKGRKDAKARRSTQRGHLNSVISKAIYGSLHNRKDGKHWEKLVGYTLKELCVHLEKQFRSNMSWENYGEWHIDHKVPISAFNFEKPEDLDFKKCWALSNLQPMWAKENLLKSTKLEKEFQPSFSF